MNQSLSSSGSQHDAVLQLIPWYAGGRLDADERERVAEHLAGCEACRAELEAERTLAAAMAAALAPPVSDADRAWHTFAARLDRTPVAAVPPPRRRTREAFAQVRRAVSRPATLRWVAAAQFAAVLALGAALVSKPQDGPYRVLGDAAVPRAGNVLAMFRPETSEARLRAALLASGARLVDGPTAAHAYLLDVPGGAEGPALARLRRNPEVTMAEPIEQAPAE